MDNLTFMNALSKAVWFAVQPGNLFLIFLSVASVLSWVSPRRNCRNWLTGLAVPLLLITFLPIEVWIARPLENRFPPPAHLPDRIDGIIVLGGVLSAHITHERDTLTLYQNAERIMMAVMLAFEHPEARLVISGHGENDETLLNWLSMIGLDPDRVEFEANSRNTFENAIFSYKQIHPLRGEIWILVTSAYHMPRAVGVFRKVGWPVLPYPVDYRTADAEFFRSWPNFATKLWHINNSAKEWIGLAVYYLMGRTDALFAAPDLKQAFGQPDETP